MDWLIIRARLGALGRSIIGEGGRDMWKLYWVVCPDCHREICYIKILAGEKLHFIVEGLCRHCNKVVSCELDTLQTSTVLLRWDSQRRE